MYSASVLDMAVIFYFFDDQLANLSPNSYILPDVLFLVSWEPAWSASTKALKGMQESFEYHITIFMVPFSANSWQWDLHSSGSGNTLHWQWELILPLGTLSWQWECLVHFIPNNNGEETCDNWLNHPPRIIQ
uniref:Uncharacterized protein n=1 Tax=Tanacetum cinerariifolium TaxID=118510 RepID=A0A6L2M8W4_TANCI|nr:hypothetical protein [Tanacetum cinerariifolium]